MFDKKQTVIETDFATGETPSYFNVGTADMTITPLPDNLFKITSNDSGGLTEVSSTFKITPSDYNKIILEFSDVTASLSDISCRFGLFGTGESCMFHVNDPGYLEWTNDVIEVAGSFASLPIELFRNVDFSLPLDYKMECNVKEQYVDFIIEGSRARLEEVNFTTDLNISFGRIQTKSVGTTKFFSFKKFKLTLE